MVTALYLFRYLYYLLFLKGFRYLDKFTCVAVDECLVYVSYGIQAHNHIPPEGFLENLKGPRLVYKIRHLGGILSGGSQKYQSVLIRLDVPNAGDQFAVIVVRGISKRVVVCVSLTACFKQEDLVLVAGLSEFLDGLFRLYVIAVERHIKGHQLLHPFSNGRYVFHGEIAVVLLSQVDEDAVADGVLHIHLALRQYILGSLVQ